MSRDVHCHLSSIARPVLAAAALVLVSPLVRADPSPEPGRAPSWPARAETSVDADRLLRTVRELVELGHRWYGAPKRDVAIEHLAAALSQVTDSVSRSSFLREEKVSGVTYRLVNLIGRLRPSASRRIVLGTHWDTRLWAEEDPDPAKRSDPIPGANDGTSGIAVVLEVARAVRAHGPEDLGIDVVLFDGEEFGRPGSPRYCQGSAAFARDLETWYPDALPLAAIVVDMVGDRDLRFRREGYSMRSAPALVDTIWRHGASLRPDVFVDETGSSILDDHVPLQKAGVPAVLVIDLDYPYWHTHADTIDKIDKGSLETVARVLVRALADWSGDPR